MPNTKKKPAAKSAKPAVKAKAPAKPIAKAKAPAKPENRKQNDRTTERQTPDSRQTELQKEDRVWTQHLFEILLRTSICYDSVYRVIVAGMRALSNLPLCGSGRSCRPRPARSPLSTSIPLRGWARLRRVFSSHRLRRRHFLRSY